jgi:Protein of unknown function (DUF3014)
MHMDDKKPIAIIAVVIVAFLGGGAWWMSRRARTSTNATPTAVTSTEAPIDKPAPPVNLPPLDEMDAFLRPLLSALSSRPELAKWLATDDLVRQLAAALDQASGGGSPARDFKVIGPAKPFVAAGRGRRRTIDPASYRRYDGLVETVTSIDASNVAKIYKTIRPRLNEAYQGMGNPNRDVDRALQQTLEILLDTPVVKDPISLIEGDGAGWVYADDELEELAPTQKQLLRMGPANVDRLLVWLRALQAALA